ncbi:hypothetical protein ACP4OV_018477 [Aristida adscensionis]
MAQSKGDMKHGTMRTKVAGEDEMLRTGFHNGTALEAGKIADAQPVDLFAPATRLAAAAGAGADDDGASQQQQPQRVIAESEPVDLNAAARGVAEANDDRGGEAPAARQGRVGRQGMAEHAAGGRRLGRQ